MMEDRRQIGKQNIQISYVQIGPTGFFLLIIEYPLNPNFGDNFRHEQSKFVRMQLQC